MSRKEIKQIEVFELLKQEEITQCQAALRLGWSTRWVREKFKRYLDEGVDGLVHQSRGRSSNRKWDQKEKDAVLRYIEEMLPGFGPTLAFEYVGKAMKLSIRSVETLRKMMREAGLSARRRKGRSPKHRKRRERREHVGELVQIDGSEHDWFQGRLPKCTLLVAIDDATSSIQHLLFVPSESTKSYMQFLQEYIIQHGRPLAFYADRHSALYDTDQHADRQIRTQVGRVIRELDIQLIHAHSPQAKGRVERANGTMQDRLINMMSFVGISTIEQANTFVHDVYIPDHNRRFAHPPAQDFDMHRAHDSYDIPSHFCTQHTRVVARDFTLSYNNRIFQLSDHQIAHVRPKDRVTVCEYLDGRVVLKLRSYELAYTELEPRSQPPRTAVQHVNAERQHPCITVPHTLQLPPR